MAAQQTHTHQAPGLATLDPNAVLAQYVQGSGIVKEAKVRRGAIHEPAAEIAPRVLSLRAAQTVANVRF